MIWVATMIQRTETRSTLVAENGLAHTQTISLRKVMVYSYTKRAYVTPVVSKSIRYNNDYSLVIARDT